MGALLVLHPLAPLPASSRHCPPSGATPVRKEDRADTSTPSSSGPACALVAKMDRSFTATINVPFAVAPPIGFIMIVSLARRVIKIPGINHPCFGSCANALRNVRRGTWSGTCGVCDEICVSTKSHVTYENFKPSSISIETFDELNFFNHPCFGFCANLLRTVFREI